MSATRELRSAGGVWLTLDTRDARDPSLRLKSGYAQDDNAVENTEPHH
ncbi:MAG TPA: hypothetical protein VNY51_11310 [Candidatus Dormibacteraeota bacterium]|nr:hypothetical protein [Candidatus Dormibacteraeota bacterium]